MPPVNRKPCIFFEALTKFSLFHFETKSMHLVQKA